MTLKAGMDESGVVLFVDVDVYSDSGFSFAEDTAEYVALTWKVHILQYTPNPIQYFKPWDTLFLGPKKRNAAHVFGVL